MRTVRYILLAFAGLFLLVTMACPFGVSMSMRGWYIDGGAATAESLSAEMAKARGSLGALAGAMDVVMKDKLEAVEVMKTMARWELGMIPLALVLMVTMFLSKRVIPRSAAGVLALAAVLAIATTPNMETGFSTTRFEIMMVCVPALVGAVFAVLASLIRPKLPA
jgi:hypothetical protein